MNTTSLTMVRHIFHGCIFVHRPTSHRDQVCVEGSESSKAVAT